mmetsp:Transcript_77761/g.172194  ORF Transcript_77761/g.172194 Transcript_77761/m.172194 type:complete len:336 (+) Transcript_77761:2073-3080(+)
MTPLASPTLLKQLLSGPSSVVGVCSSSAHAEAGVTRALQEADPKAMPGASSMTSSSKVRLRAVRLPPSPTGLLGSLLPAALPRIRSMTVGLCPTWAPALPLPESDALSPWSPGSAGGDETARLAMAAVDVASRLSNAPPRLIAVAEVWPIAVTEVGPVAGRLARFGSTSGRPACAWPATAHNSPPLLRRLPALLVMSAKELHLWKHDPASSSQAAGAADRAAPPRAGDGTVDSALAASAPATWRPAKRPSFKSFVAPALSRGSKADPLGRRGGLKSAAPAVAALRPSEAAAPVPQSIAPKPKLSKRSNARSKVLHAELLLAAAPAAHGLPRESAC